jgi:hypothetical protein
MSGPTITIKSPSTGDSVGRPFTASGVFTSIVNPPITVVLKDSGGTVVATGNPVTVGTGIWSAVLSPTQGYTDASVFAAITGTPAQNTVGSLTVT